MASTKNNLVIAYCRYSSDNQRDESIDAQVRAIKEFCSRNGYILDRVYADEARTATTDNRPQFQQIFRDITPNRYHALIVHKLDRFARDRYDSAHYKRKLKECGMRLISVVEHLDDSPESIILESVLEGMSEYYSKNLAREVMKGMRETAYQGKHVGGVPPLGYAVNQNQEYEVNPTEAVIVRTIFNMYDMGFSYSNIRDDLNMKGHKTRQGKPFTISSFHDLLKNPKYKGDFVFNQTASKAPSGKRNNHALKELDDIIYIKDRIPPIVEADLWERVNRKMTGRKQNGAKKAKNVYLLSGIIECGECHGAMCGNTRICGRNKTPYASYECVSRRREKNCQAKSIGKEYIEAQILSYLADSFFTEENVQCLTQKLYSFSQSSKAELDTDIPVFRTRLKEVEEKMKNIMDAIANGFYSPAMNETMKELESDKNTLIGLISELEAKQNRRVFSEDEIRHYIMKDKDIKDKSPEEQKAIIQTYIEKVEIFHDHVDMHMIVDLNVLCMEK
jgi:site-specific DNA recombinase